MKRFSNRWLFASAFVVGLVVVLGLIAATAVKPAPVKPLTDVLFVPEQLKLDQIHELTREPLVPSRS